MRKLEKFLIHISNEITESNSTTSKYYQIENCRIRVSDHYSLANDADLTIIIPLNKSTKYLLCSKESTSFYLWSTNEIIEFIPHLVKFCNLQKKNIKKDKLDTEFKIIKIHSKYFCTKQSKNIGKIITHPKNKSWTRDELKLLIFLISNDLDIHISKLPKEFEDFLISHECTYLQVLNLYKAVYIDNNIEIIDSTIFVKMLNLLK